jgi:hypothetical protein
MSIDADSHRDTALVHDAASLLLPEGAELCLHEDHSSNPVGERLGRTTSNLVESAHGLLKIRLNIKSS